jgi:hypothetical protein
MGKLTVALNPHMKWPIQPPHADEIGAALLRKHPEASDIMVMVDEFQAAARTSLTKHPVDDEGLASLLEQLGLEEKSTMALVKWDRQ